MSDDSNTHPAGEGLSDEEFVEQVGGQTASDLKAEDVFERESDAASTDGPINEADADDLN
ncbi:MAG: hypothetical protein JWM76_2601 [Pseudonocardiales bacterium]|nr:hypothetical protein [Pseudonocardiales bacterium]